MSIPEDIKTFKFRAEQYFIKKALKNFKANAFWDQQIDEMVGVLTKTVYAEKLKEIEVEFYFPATWYDHLKMALNNYFDLDLKVNQKRHARIMDFTLEFPDYEPRPEVLGAAIRVIYPNKDNDE